MASGRGLLKVDLEPSTWRRRQEYKATPSAVDTSRETRVRRKDTIGTVKRLTKPLDEPKKEFQRLRRAAWRQHQNESLAIAERNLFDDEASSSNNTRTKPPTPLKTLREHSHPNSSRPHEADECEQNNLAGQVYLSGGDIYDDPSFLRFYQNDDTPPWGNNKCKEKRKYGPEWVVRSKFKDELANFMLKKKSHTKGIGEMLDQHYKEMHE
nr:hypothetical protein [Tanacetum cinerariifolium]